MSFFFYRFLDVFLETRQKCNDFEVWAEYRGKCTERLIVQTGWSTRVIVVVLCY